MRGFDLPSSPKRRPPRMYRRAFLCVALSSGRKRLPRRGRSVSIALFARRASPGWTVYGGIAPARCAGPLALMHLMQVRDCFFVARHHLPLLFSVIAGHVSDLAAMRLVHRHTLGAMARNYVAGLLLAHAVSRLSCSRTVSCSMSGRAVSTMTIAHVVSRHTARMVVQRRTLSFFSHDQSPFVVGRSKAVTNASCATVARLCYQSMQHGMSPLSP